MTISDSEITGEGDNSRRTPDHIYEHDESGSFFSIKEENIGWNPKIP